MLKINPEEVERRITEFIKDIVGDNGVVVGLSGGIDSAVVATLCVEALGRGDVLALLMPETGVSHADDLRDATEHAHALDIEHVAMDIHPIAVAYAETIPDYNREDLVSRGNLRARIRMSILYYYANTMNRLVAGTGNKSEILLGYSTKWGDAAADFHALAHLYKTQVRDLARHLGVSHRIIEKPPSAGLWPGQTDEEELGVTYEEADPVLWKLVEEDKTPGEAAHELDIPMSTVERVVELIEASKHKREPIREPGL